MNFLPFQPVGDSVLTDPQDIVVSGTTFSMPRTSVGKDQAEYRSADGLFRYSISHQYGKRTRHLVRLDADGSATDPFTSLEIPVSTSVYLVIDRPKNNGLANTTVKAYADALLAELTASSGALITKILGGES
jgi:hypothetical protein